MILDNDENSEEFTTKELKDVEIKFGLENVTILFDFNMKCQ